MAPPVITLTTDFGLSDCYAGVMKGAILAGCPTANIIDLCHTIPPQDIFQAANLIYANYVYFPTNTLHVIVVDPGVGSNRKIILAEACGHYFLAPDNGVLSRFINKNQLQGVFCAMREDLYLTPTSQTFHGRDIFAPLAAHLACGNPPDSIGTAHKITELVTTNLHLPHIDPANETITGEIITIDHFGNLATNITANDIKALKIPTESLQLTIKGQTICGSIKANYASTKPQETLLLFNSQNTLEIALNQGNAQTLFNASLYDKVTLKRHS